MPEEKAAGTTDCRDGQDSGDTPPYQTSSVHAVMSNEEGAVPSKQLLVGGGVGLGCTGKLQVIGNYPWLTNKMLLCGPFKPKLFSDG